MDDPDPNGRSNLEDAILDAQAMAGADVTGKVDVSAGVSGNRRISVADLFYILQNFAGFR